MPTLPPDASHPGLQIVWLMVLALPIATVAWTITHEELFRELRELLRGREQDLPHAPGP